MAGFGEKRFGAAACKFLLPRPECNDGNTENVRGLVAADAGGLEAKGGFHNPNPAAAFQVMLNGGKVQNAQLRLAGHLKPESAATGIPLCGRDKDGGDFGLAGHK